MLSDNDLLQLLAKIEAMALQHYPFPDDAQHDPQLPFALGRIAGIAGAAVRAARPPAQSQNAPAAASPAHVDSPLCWCGPAEIDPGFLVHWNWAGYERPHAAAADCWCNPVPDDSEADVWIHRYQPTQHAAIQGEDA
jgi:hypothetical protein